MELDCTLLRELSARGFRREGTLNAFRRDQLITLRIYGVSWEVFDSKVGASLFGGNTLVGLLSWLSLLPAPVRPDRATVLGHLFEPSRGMFANEPEHVLYCAIGDYGTLFLDTDTGVVTEVVGSERTEWHPTMVTSLNYLL